MSRFINLEPPYLRFGEGVVLKDNLSAPCPFDELVYYFCPVHECNHDPLTLSTCCVVCGGTFRHVTRRTLGSDFPSLSHHAATTPLIPATPGLKDVPDRQSESSHRASAYL